MKKNILIIASNFPPNKRAGGVIRIVKLIKYLPITIWNPIVITTKSKYQNNNDRLYNEISNKCEIYRLPQCDIRIVYQRLKYLYAKFNLFKIFKKKKKAKISKESKIPISSNFLIPDHLILWAFLSFIKSFFICVLKKIDLIYVTSPSQSGLLVGLCLKKTIKIPLIVDYRDPWTTNPFHIKRVFSFLNKIENKLEFSVLNNADKIIVINVFFIESIIKKFPTIDQNKFEVVPNGFDKDDFKDIKPIVTKKHNIVHAGNFYLGRSPVPFLKAFANLIKNNLEFFNNWELTLVGSGNEFKKDIENLGISNYVNIIGHVSHQEAIGYMLGSKTLLLVPGIGKTTLTGKIFEYIGARKPIFVMGNESAASKLVEDLRIGTTCPEDNLDLLSKSLSAFLKNLDSYNYRDNIEHKINNYDRKVIAETTSNIMIKMFK
jgi:hypothetical protein